MLSNKFRVFVILCVINYVCGKPLLESQLKVSKSVKPTLRLFSSVTKPSGTSTTTAYDYEEAADEFNSKNLVTSIAKTSWQDKRNPWLTSRRPEPTKYTSKNIDLNSTTTEALEEVEWVNYVAKAPPKNARKNIKMHAAAQKAPPKDPPDEPPKEPAKEPSNEPPKELTISIPKFKTDEFGFWVDNPWAVTFGQVWRDTRYNEDRYATIERMRVESILVKYYFPDANPDSVCIGRSTVYNRPRVDTWLTHRVDRQFLQQRPILIALRKEIYKNGNSEECHTPQQTVWRPYIECAMRRHMRLEYMIPMYPLHQVGYRAGYQTAEPKSYIRKSLIPNQ